MKLAPLLSQYLFTHKRLDLPGIGSFLLDPRIYVEQETGKHAKSSLPEGISFESNTAMPGNPDLVSFIAAQTGKMKALAAADLNSHLELAQQFLNIGKPFLFEGIGSLVKVRSGQYEFAVGQVSPEKVKEYSLKEISATSTTEDSFTDYQNVFNPVKTKARWKRPVLALLLVLGLGLAIWAGYTMSKKKTEPVEDASEVKQEDTKKEETVPVVARDTTTNPIDTASKEIPAPSIPEGNYKFILETANEKRAFERYNRLRSYYWNVHMETKDSQLYKLYLVLQALASDTARMVDSLSMVNGRRVYIEN